MNITISDGNLEATIAVTMKGKAAKPSALEAQMMARMARMAKGPTDRHGIPFVRPTMEPRPV